MFKVTSAWKSAFPEAYAGVLVMRDVVNPVHQPELEKHKIELEEKIRSQFSGQDRAAMSNHPILQAYNSYYRRFKKTYHVQLQLESIAWKDKSIPSVSALVEAEDSRLPLDRSPRTGRSDLSGQAVAPRPRSAQ